MLTAKGDEFDRVLGLELGRTTIFQNPSVHANLCANRSYSSQIRVAIEGSSALRPPVIRSGDLELDPSLRAASRGGEVLHLTSAEYDILRLFIDHPDRCSLAKS